MFSLKIRLIISEPQLQGTVTRLVYWTEIWQHIIPPGLTFWQGKGVKPNKVPVPGDSVKLLTACSVVQAST